MVLYRPCLIMFFCSYTATSVLVPVAKPSRAEASVLGKVPGNLKKIFMQLV